MSQWRKQEKHSESIDYQFDFDNIYNKFQSDLNIFEFTDIEFNWKDENDLKQLFPKFYLNSVHFIKKSS